MSLVLVNKNNVPVGFAGIAHCVGNNVEMINPSCSFCLSHFSSLATVVPTSISGPPTLREAREALKAVMRYFELQ